MATNAPVVNRSGPRVGHPAYVKHLGTAVRKGAPVRRFLPGHLKRSPGRRLLPTDIGDRGQQCTGIRVGRSFHDGIARSSLNDPSAEEYKHPVRKVAGGGEVMCNKQYGKPALEFELGKKIENPHTYRDIEHGSGFIRNQQVWFNGEGSGYGHTLALST